MPDQDDDLLQKADALMKRRRVFVAGAGEEPRTEAPAISPESDEDIPLLTDVVGPDALAEPPALSAVDVAAVRRALAAELESWLDTEMPMQVQRVLDGVTDQLILQLSGKARAELLPKLQALLSQAQQGPEADDAGQ